MMSLTLPTLNREELPFSKSTSSCVISIISSIGNCAPLITKPVMSFVSEAMGNTALSFLLNKTSLVF